MAQKKKPSSKSKKQSPISAFLAKLNPNSPKKKLLAFAIVFAIAGGGYYAYSSYANWGTWNPGVYGHTKMPKIYHTRFQSDRDHYVLYACQERVPSKFGELTRVHYMMELQLTSRNPYLRQNQSIDVVRREGSMTRTFHTARFLDYDRSRNRNVTQRIGSAMMSRGLGDTHHIKSGNTRFATVSSNTRIADCIF
jgi:hypothetical protein